MHAVIVIAGKSLLLLWRDRMGFFWWMVGFPMLIAVLIGTIFAGVLEGPTRPMAVGLIDQARSTDSAAFIEALRQSPGLELRPGDLAAAAEAVRTGRLTAYLVLPESFRLSPSAFWDKRLPVAVGIDPARRAELAFLEAAVTESALRMLRDQWADPTRRPHMIQAWLADLAETGALGPAARAGLETALGAVGLYLTPSTAPVAAPTAAPGVPLPLGRLETLPIGQALRPASAFEVCFPLGMIWGLLGLAAECAAALAKERQSGTLLRLRIAPVSRLSRVAGEGLATFLACLGVMSLLLAVGTVGFGVRVTGLPALAMACAATGVCFVGLTLLLSEMGRTELAVSGAAWAVLLVMAMVGGGMVPQMFLPEWMLAVGAVSPVKWAILGFEGGIWRGFGPGDMLRPCAVLVGQGLACGLIGFAALCRRER